MFVSLMARFQMRSIFVTCFRGFRVVSCMEGGWWTGLPVKNFTWVGNWCDVMKKDR